jgi:hypothetical protein
MRAAQRDIEHGQRGLTKADEGRLLARPRLGAVTWIVVAFAALCLVWFLAGGGLLLLGGAAFWALVALLNEHLRARGRARRGE